MKPHGGFSYIEMLIALSLFSLLVLTSLPLLRQSGLNLGFAQDGYNAHLAAQSIMLAVRDSHNRETIAADYAKRLGVDYYTVWIFERENAISFGAAAFETNVSITATDKEVIVVAVFNPRGQVIGRSVGVINNRHK